MDDLNCNLLKEALKATRFIVLPRCPLLFTAVPDQDSKAQRVRVANALTRVFAASLGRPVERNGEIGLMDSNEDLLAEDW